MRRKSSLILLGLAVFCVALAPLLREYAFPRLVAKALSGEKAYKTMVLQAENATLFGAPEGAGKAKALMIQTVKPNAKLSKDGTVVWDMNLAMVDSAGSVLTQIPERYAFDAVTQAPVNCCGESIDNKPVAHTGIQYKWPFFTEKRDYNYYDAQSHTAAPIFYKGTQNFNGLNVYFFEQEVKWTKVPLPSQMPGGLTPASIEASGMERWYTTVRRFWVEPVTGAPVYAEEDHQEEMRTPPPAEDPTAQPTVMKVFDGKVKMLPQWSNKLVEDAKEQSAQMKLIHDQLPLGLVVVGVLLFVGALVREYLGRSRPGAAHAASGDDKPKTPGPTAKERLGAFAGKVATRLQPATEKPEPPEAPEPPPGRPGDTEVLPPVPAHVGSANGHDVQGR